MAFVGEEQLRLQGYSEEQLRGLESGARAIDAEPQFVGGKISLVREHRAVEGPTVARVARGAGIVGKTSYGEFVVLPRGYVKTRLTAVEREWGRLPAAAKSFDPQTGELVMKTGERVVIKSPQEMAVLREKPPVAKPAPEPIVSPEKAGIIKIEKIREEARGPAWGVLAPGVTYADVQREMKIARHLPGYFKPPAPTKKPQLITRPALEVGADVRRMLPLQVVDPEREKEAIEQEKRWRRETGYQRIGEAAAVGTGVGAVVGGVFGGPVGAAVGGVGGAAAGWTGTLWEDIAFIYAPPEIKERHLFAKGVGLGAGIIGYYGASWLASKAITAGITRMPKEYRIATDVKTFVAKEQKGIEQFYYRATGRVGVKTKARLLGKPLLQREFGVSIKGRGLVSGFDEYARLSPEIRKLALWTPKGAKVVTTTGWAKTVPRFAKTTKYWFGQTAVMYPEQAVVLGTKPISYGTLTQYVQRVPYISVTKGGLVSPYKQLWATRGMGDVRAWASQTVVDFPGVTKIGTRGITVGRTFVPTTKADISVLGMFKTKKVIPTPTFRPSWTTTAGKVPVSGMRGFTEMLLKAEMEKTLQQLAENVVSTTVVQTAAKTGAVVSAGVATLGIPRAVQRVVPREEEELIYYLPTMPSIKEMADVDWGQRAFGAVATMPSVVPRVMPRVAVGMRVFERVVTKQFQLQPTKPKERALELAKEKAIVKELERQASRIVPITRAVQMPRQAPKQVPRLTLRQWQRLWQPQRSITAITPQFEMIAPTPTALVPPFLFLVTRKKRKGMLRRLAKGFLPQIKRRGEWISIGFPMTRKMAEQWGAFYAMETPARSYRILLAEKPARRAKSPRLPLFWKTQFRKPKTPALLKAGAMVEKSKYAIRERGEYFGITRKGLEALAGIRRKRRRRR